MQNNTEINKWDDIELKEDILRGIYAYGFEIPSEIQKKAILPIIQEKDIIAQAQSGSGKTGTFSIGTLQRIDHTLNSTQALIISPTHELVRQTANVVQSIGQYLNGLKVKTLIGGSPVRDDIYDLKRNVPHVVIGTVGRVLDMMQRGYLNLNDLKIFIMDEADEMLSQGFHEKIRLMFEQYFSPKVQVVLFSATIPSDINTLSKRLMNNPEMLLMKKEDLTLKCIQQYFVPVSDEQLKFDTLISLFSRINSSKLIIYCNSVNRVHTLYELMKERNFSVEHIHSNMDKTTRNNVFKSFRDGDARILISSDLTARGIDVQQVSLVINYDITRNIHTYLHRIGRGGRWGRKGVAINLVTQYDVHDMKRIETYYQNEILPLPADNVIL